MNQSIVERWKEEGIPFANTLGVTFTQAEAERVTATLSVREELCTMMGTLQGGAIMAIADILGAVATFYNLGDGEGTTTIESKTNFLAAIPVGQTAYAECLPIHRGRTTQVWQTIITREDGRKAAIVTQTQLVTAAK